MKSSQTSVGAELDLTIVTTDTRLARILGGDEQACAVELWVLQLQVHGAAETRLLYGRVSPYDFSNARWSALAEDQFKVVRNGLSAQCVRLTLYCSSNGLLNLLGAMTKGCILEEASKNAGMSMSTDFQRRFGVLKLQLPLALRPSMHLPTRDYFRRSTNKVSPIDSCSCDSASICSLVKSEIFLVEGEEDRELASFAIDLLSADTGLNFADLDTWRLGDLELLVLPGLNELGGSLVHLKSVSDGVTVQVEQPLAIGANNFRVHIRLLNDGAVFHIASEVIGAGVPYPAMVHFNWSPAMKEIRDAFVLEIEAQNAQTGATWLCYQWGAFLVRETHLMMHIAGGQARFQSDWLSKALRPAHKSRLDEVQQIARHTTGTESIIGGRKADPWVFANRHLSSLVKGLVPPRSKGGFFLRYSEGENTGRLELAEWIQRLLADHKDKHIAWFDPYMEDMGIHLLNTYGSESGTYTVFTGAGRGKSTPWWEYFDVWMKGDAQPEEHLDRRIKNLLTTCKDWLSRYGSVRLRVFGLPQADLHDRMVLVRDARMRPVVGYHLSNSLQKANENYPLLITPIPDDVLQRVLDYSDELLRSSSVGRQTGSTVKLQCLFDSDEEKGESPRYIPSDELATDRVGEILDWWLSSSEFAGADASTLKGLLDARGFLRGGQLQDKVFEHLPAKIWQEGVQCPNFNSAWDAIGAVLCSTRAGDTIYEAPDASVPPLREALLKYLDSDRPDAVQPPARRTMMDMTTVLSKSLAEFMKQGGDPQEWFPYDVTEVSWGDYYALKALWATDPAALVTWVEEGAGQRFRENRRRQLGLKCAARLISFEIYRSCSSRQLDALLKSANGLLRWIGYIAFESLVLVDPKTLSSKAITSLLDLESRLVFLGWMTARAIRRNAPMRKVLIQELHASMPVQLDQATLRRSVDSMRNVVGQVYGTPTWMMQDVLVPLMTEKRIDVDIVAKLWFEELFNIWTNRSTSSIIFSTDEEGRFTDEVASLCAAASSNVRGDVLNRVTKVVAAHVRVVQRPFSAQINWNSYDDAFQLLLWISGFLWAWHEKSPRPSQIEKVLQSAELALSRRTEGEWDRLSSSKQQLLCYRESHIEVETRHLP